MMPTDMPAPTMKRRDRFDAAVRWFAATAVSRPTENALDAPQATIDAEQEMTRSVAILRPWQAEAA